MELNYFLTHDQIRTICLKIGPFLKIKTKKKQAVKPSYEYRELLCIFCY